MPSEDILRKAIEKAVKNGLVMESVPNYCKPCKEVHHLPQPEAFIFSHDFAMAFWGEEKLVHRLYGSNAMCDGKHLADYQQASADDCQPIWKHHLQQLALAEDRLAYLEKFL